MTILSKNCRALVVAALACAGSARAQPCTPLAAALAAAPKFEAYRVARPSLARPAPLDLRGNAAARRYRTALREAQREGPNFAGRYTIAGWGCGTGCLDWGVIDSASGKVTFDAGIRTLQNPAEDWDRYKKATEIYARRGANRADFDLLLFRRDSALLITLEPRIQDAAREGLARDGIAYWRWNGRRFARVHFVPAKSICRAG